MDSLELMRELSVEASTKILLVVLDGLGGLPIVPGGPTELEMARTPNLDALAAEGVCGLHDPIAPGITPGSGPGHLGLFGYDPVRYNVGRGVPETLGIGIDLGPKDVAARGNFCTVDPATGVVTDRRAGRISTERCIQLSQCLNQIRLPEAEVFVHPVKEHRFIVVFRAEGLDDRVTETDPQKEGKVPPPVEPLEPGHPGAERLARLANAFIAQAREVLSHEEQANMVLLRGFAKMPEGVPSFREVYKLKAACIAIYPMYRGLAKLVGMEVLPVGEAIAEEFDLLEQVWPAYDFVFLHVKPTDSAGEDGDFIRRVRLIEEVDAQIARVRGLNPPPDVVVVTGDHSTPAMLRSHSWHPVPLLLWSRTCRPDDVMEFSERACLRGGLGRIRAVEIMPLAMAHALRLEKFGA